MYQRQMKSHKSTFWIRLIRAGRVVILTVCIYQFGYQQGIVTYAKDPKKMESDILDQILNNDDNDEKKTLIYGKHTKIHRRVESISQRVLHAAREYCHEKVKDTEIEINNQMEQENIKSPNNKKTTLTEGDPLIQKLTYWKDNSKKMDHDWGVIVTNSMKVNAFVTGMCQYKIFVHEGLLAKLQMSDDELAMIISHELSHVILGHTNEAMTSNAFIMGTQLVIMSLVDPTGMTSFLFDMILAQIMTYIMAAYSREHEEEADNLGVELLGKSCFNVHEGVEVFEKLANIDHKKYTNWSDTHPSSMERFQKLSHWNTSLQQKYQGICESIRNDFIHSIFGRK